jgi:antitoxin FitA
MVAEWLSRKEEPMPISVTVKNIPESLYEQLRLSAQTHHRSLNGEIIACLESLLSPTQVSVQERLARARELRNSLGAVQFSAEDIDALKNQGRP